MNDIKEIIAMWRKTIDEKLNEIIEREYEERVAGVAKYIVKGGKRLRGTLAIMVATALGGRAEDAMNAALALELVHAASLSIDDIIDGDVQRRGMPSSWVINGIEDTVMVSNLLIPHAISMVKVYGRKAIDKVIETWWNISKGEIWDVHGPPIDDVERGYEAILEYKTASLFALAGYLGALAAGKDEYLDTAWEYGFTLGKAYQIADDLADIENDKSYSAKLFREIIKKKGISYIKKWLYELVKESSRIGATMSETLAELPRQGVAFLLGEPIEI